MDKAISSIDYLANRINGAETIPDAINATISFEELFNRAQETEKIEKNSTGNRLNKVPDNLVDQIKAHMGNGKKNTNINNAAKAAESAIKQLIADGKGKNVTGIVIDSDGYTIRVTGENSNEERD